MEEKQRRDELSKDFREDHTIIGTLSKILFTIFIIFGFYIHFHGDIRAGGGFQSGIIFSIAVLLHDLLQYHVHYNDLMCEKVHTTNIALLGLFIFFILVFVPTFLHKQTAFSYKFLFPGNKVTANFLGVFLFEIAISLIIFSSFIRIMRSFFHLLKKENILN